MNINDFKRECERIKSMVNYYLPLCKTLFDRAQSKVFRKEYSVGGQCIYRGYYCPDIISDIVIGNNSRGRIYKNIVPNNYDYVYGFDSSGNLLTVQKFENNEWCQEYEFIVYDEKKEIGITFSKIDEKVGIVGVSECERDGEKIIYYSKYSIDGFYDNSVIELTKHIYKYTDNHMLVYCYNFINCNYEETPISSDCEMSMIFDKLLSSLKKMPIEYHVDKSKSAYVKYDVYDFKIVNGYLDSYIVENAENTKLPDDTKIYKVNVRRKIRQ